MLSHPNKELKDHLENVSRLGLNIFNNRKTIWSNNKTVIDTLEIILLTHDFGKATLIERAGGGVEEGEDLTDEMYNQHINF